jgi:2-dehydrotetronate isomerase
MPRFAANLGHLFTERPLIERFGAAAAAGFPAVELQFPYDVPTAAVVAELKKHNLTQLAVNTPQGPEFGLAAIPGRERDFEAAFTRALDYVSAIGGTGIHCMTGVVDVNARPAAEKVFIGNIARAAAQAAAKNITLLIEPINQRDRPGYFLSHLEHAADLVTKIGAPNVRIQFDFYHLQITRWCSRRSTGSATKAGSAANTSPRRAPRMGSAGRGLMASCRKPIEEAERAKQGEETCVSMARRLW